MTDSSVPDEQWASRERSIVTPRLNRDDAEKWASLGKDRGREVVVVISAQKYDALAARPVSAGPDEEGLRAGVEALADSEDHADTCAAALSPEAGYDCTCWKSRFRALLAATSGGRQGDGTVRSGPQEPLSGPRSDEQGSGEGLDDYNQEDA